ncbi:2-oxoacid:acceptor oxidoreductase subunit alpha [Desulfobacter sp.]|uniref:2-oxoacid:acceptor oxidoreductase subunit alpha n=1 Tax=Desulfobacter sp. TaxID=2294 RepID=UPI003D10A55F
MTKNIQFIPGSDACIEGALYAGCDFFAGYPITPSSEVAEGMSAALPKRGGKFIQMEDEIASMACIIGACLSGKKVMTATSGPGFSLKQEGIGYACMAELPCVVVNVQRGGPSTGNPTHVSQGDTMQARWGTHGDHSIIAMTASNLQDLFTTTVEAFNFSETYRTPVILMFDEATQHLREKVVIPEPGEIKVVDRLRTTIPVGEKYYPYLTDANGKRPMSDFGAGHRYNVTGLHHNISGFPDVSPKNVDDLIHHLVEKIENKATEIARYKEYYMDDAEYVIVAYGTTTRSAIQAAEDYRNQLGIKVGVFELQTVWPFADEIVKEKCANAKAVIVAEMNMGQIVREVSRVLAAPGKVFLSNRANNEIIKPSDIKASLKMIIGKGV